MDSIISYIRNPAALEATAAGRQIVVTVRRRREYAILNRLGSILLVLENRRLIRRPNVADQLSIRIDRPLEYLENLHQAQAAPVSIQIAGNAIVHLMYCHRDVEKLNSETRQILLYGPVEIRLRDHREKKIDNPDAWLTLLDRSVVFPLGAGDRLVLTTGQYHVRVSAEVHCIYIPKDRILADNEVVYYEAASGVGDANLEQVGQPSTKLVDYVKSLA